MSRIHEALKKAAEERAAVQSVLPTDAPNAAPTRGADGASFDVPPRETPVAPPAGNYLRFDDLCARCSRAVWHLDPSKNVFLNSEKGTHGAEQFRTLRSRLYRARSHSQEPLRRLLITSAVPGEGKTFIANNLAQAIARHPDRRVLLIDADLRSSRLHMPLGTAVTPGLTDYLQGEADEVAVIQHGMEGNLCFIPGGNAVANPSELLANARFRMLLDRVTPVFDWIILDSPPCLPVADASIVAEHCDGVLLVVRAGSTPSASVQRTCQELQTRNVVGVALNAINEADTYGMYSYEAYASSNGDSDLKLVES